jgi:hypothetical protein
MNSAGYPTWALEPPTPKQLMLTRSDLSTGQAIGSIGTRNFEVSKRTLHDQFRVSVARPGASDLLFGLGWRK